MPAHRNPNKTKDAVQGCIDNGFKVKKLQLSKSNTMAGLDADFPLNEAILEGDSYDQQKGCRNKLTQILYIALPAGTTNASALRSPKSEWSDTAKIEAKDKHGRKVTYFLKCCAGRDDGEARLKGEYLSMMELWKTVPAMVSTYASSHTCSLPDLVVFA